LDLLPHAAFGVTCAAIAGTLLVAMTVLALALVIMRWEHRRAVANEARLRQQLLRRDRAVRELYDELLQGMHGLVLRFHASGDRLSPPDVPGELEAVLRRADQVLNDARDAAGRLQQHDVPALALANELDDAGRDLAGPRGARFELRIDGAPFTLRADDLDAYLSVTDVGVGFRLDDTEKQFKPFCTTKKSGMGMRLSVSSTIAHRQGGRRWGTPNDAGATFSVSIPCHMPAKADAQCTSLA